MRMQHQSEAALLPKGAWSLLQVRRQSLETCDLV